MSHEVRPLILHVIHHLVTGGMENGLINLINHLPEERFRHAVACVEDFSDFRQRLTRADTPVVAFHRSRTGIWRLRQGLFRLCRQLKPTIVHSRNQSGLDALLPARLAGVPHCIHGEHGWDVSDLKGQRLKPAVLRLLHSPLVDRYITVSNHLRNYLVQRVHISASRVTQIMNGVDTVRFSPPLRRSHDLFPAGFLGADSIVVGTVGRMQAVKDQETLVRAFAALAHNGGNMTTARLAIVGDGPLRGALMRLAEELGVARLIWFPGNVSHVAELLRGFDIFVLPSLAEGISNTLLEAMATGLPLVATATGGNVELVSEGINGRLFEPGDVAALTRLLADYIHDRALLTVHGDNARRLAVRHFSLSTMLVAYQAVYEEFC